MTHQDVRHEVPLVDGRLGTVDAVIVGRHPVLTAQAYRVALRLNKSGAKD